jgi:hypothetical protein
MHCELVGKFYLLPKKHIQVVRKNGEPVALKYMDSTVTSDTKAMETWRFQLVKAWLRFPQMPVRARDLNIFYLLEEHTDKLLKSELRDYVLFHTTDTLWLFLPLDGTIATETILEPYLEDGFYAECEGTTFNLDNLYPDLKGWLEERGPRGARREREKRRLEQGLHTLQQQRADLKRRVESPTTPWKERKRLGAQIPDLEREIERREGHIAELDKALKKWQREYDKV